MFEIIVRVVASVRQSLCSFGAAIAFSFRYPPGLKCWLSSRPLIADSIRWQTTYPGSAYSVPDSAKLAWPKWTPTMRTALVDAYEAAWWWLGQKDPYNNLAEPLASPPVNIHPGVADDTQSPSVWVSETYAWDLYVRWVGLALAVEIRGLVPWSVTAYTPAQLQILFDSAAIMARTAGGFMLGSGNPGHGNFVRRQDNLGASLIAPPRFTLAFLAQNGLLGTTRLETIGSLLQWARNNVAHFFGAASFANMAAHWQYRGIPPIPRIIAGTTYTGTNQFMHWTAGCHGTTGFLRNVLRAANIPVEIVRVCGHSQAHFTTEGRYLDHGDNPYNSTFKGTGLPASALLIDQATYTQWFGTNPDNHDDPAACPNVGHQVQVLAGP